MAVPEISTLPTAPSRARPTTFAEEANTFVAAMPAFGDEANILAQFCEDEGTLAKSYAEADEDVEVESGTFSAKHYFMKAEAQATAAAFSALVAAGASNYVGYWVTLSGILATPAGVFHDERLWILLEDVADITLEVPGVSTKYLEIGFNKRDDEVTSSFGWSSDKIVSNLSTTLSSGITTQAFGTNNNSAASTEFVQSAASLTGLNISATTTEINYLEESTSNIQTQLNAKADSAALGSQASYDQTISTSVPSGGSSGDVWYQV